MTSESWVVIVSRPARSAARSFRPSFDFLVVLVVEALEDDRGVTDDVPHGLPLGTNQRRGFETTCQSEAGVRARDGGVD